MTQIRFGTSGWRAVLADEFTFGNARRVVAAIAHVLLREGFAPEMAARPVPTPVLAFEIRRRGAAGALNFTASHNPPRYLGIKFSTSDGAPALPEVTDRVEKEIAGVAEMPPPEEAKVPRFDPVAPYLAELGKKVRAEDVGRGAPHFSLDFRYGTSSGFLDAFLERTGARLERLNAKADPLFGGESPQCGEKELVRLGEAVRKHGSRLGLSCDGDADRFGVCDETGKYVTPNLLL